MTKIIFSKDAMNKDTLKILQLKAKILVTSQKLLDLNEQLRKLQNKQFPK